MVIIDSEEHKSPRGPRPVPPPPLAPPPYAPLSPPGSTLSPPLPPPRSPGIRSPPSPFSAPASNFLTVKRERADITGSWNVNTALPPPHSRSFSTGSESDRDMDAVSEAASDPSAQSSIGSSATSISVPGTAARPNLKLFSPRGKIDAAIRVSGTPRAWIETVSRDEDVVVTFPPAFSGAPRPPIRFLARSTCGNVQVYLPYPFMGTLRVPSDTVLPPSLKSQSVVLAPSEPPIDRPPILDEPSKPRFGQVPSRAVTPTPPSPPLSRQVTRETPDPSPSPPVPENVPRIEVPSIETPEVAVTITAPEPEVSSTEPSPGLQLSTNPPAPTSQSLEQATHTPPTQPASETPTPAQTHAPTSPPLSPLPPTPPTLSPPTHKHHRSSSMSSLRTRTHSRSPSRSSITHPVPSFTTHDSSESSTVYFIGDLLRSSYNTNAADAWAGDEFVIDSEKGSVRVCWVGEKADVHWTEDVTGKMKDAMDWNRWKETGRGLKDVAVAMPKMSMGRVGRKFGFGK